MRIAVTGASGKLGTVVVRELRAAGHDVVGMDVVGTRGAGFVQVDFTDYGQTVDALQAVNDQHDGLDAVVHLAAIPAPGIRSDVATFHNNIAVTFNVMWAAIRLGITRIVTASSETVQGLPFDVPPPYLPVDEEYAARPRRSTRS
jgi:UDP-glucose 4-epimerase